MPGKACPAFVYEKGKRKRWKLHFVVLTDTQKSRQATGQRSHTPAWWNFFKWLSGAKASGGDKYIISLQK